MEELVTKSSCSQSNILISDFRDHYAILADFGSACPLATPAGLPDEVEERCTPSFTAPELLLPTKFGLEKMGPSKEADIYAFGMTMYQVLTGKRPFCPMRNAGIIRAVISGERPAKPENAEEVGMTDAVWNLLRECWKEDRTTRPTIGDIEDWIRDIAYPSTSYPSTPTPSPHPGVFRRFLGRVSGPVRNRAGDNKPS